MTWGIGRGVTHVGELRIALVQMRCEKGALEENLAETQRYLRDATGQGAEIVCFPEASISGYVDPTRYPEALLRLDGPEVTRFVALTADVNATAIAGLIEANPGGRPSITQIVAHAGVLFGYYRKRTIPDDEAQLFAPGAATAVFSLSRARVGLAICADLDDPVVFAENARHGARVVFEAAAPGLYGARATRDWRAGYEWWRGECFAKLGRYAREQGIFIAVATQAGRTADEDFPGGGYVFGPDGACLAETPDGSEGVLYATLDLG